MVLIAFAQMHFTGMPLWTDVQDYVWCAAARWSELCGITKVTDSIDLECGYRDWASRGFT